MPSTWGKSGSRLNISFLVDFSPSQLFDHDEFLSRTTTTTGTGTVGGLYTGSKVLHIVDNEAILGPSINEGQRTYNIKGGGWKICKGDGPMGTDTLRFYVEFPERVCHHNIGGGGEKKEKEEEEEGDVYVPRGRVYCSCGYFTFMEDGSSNNNNNNNNMDNGGANNNKETLTNKLSTIQERITELQTQRASMTQNNNPFNYFFDRIKLSREIYRWNKQAQEVNGKLMVASVREPNRRLLRFTKDGGVGLTREGGVCIQVKKGLVTEYHILGRFGIAFVDSMNN